MAEAGSKQTAASAGWSSLQFCSICLHQAKDARVLSCLHSFCKSCLEDLEMTAGCGHNHELSCPLCRFVTRLPEDGVSGLPRDITQTDEHEFRCETCKGDVSGGQAEMWCAKCAMAFCKEHVLSHALSSGHAVSPLLKEGGRGPGRQEVSLCPQHNLPLVYFCRSCNVPVCGGCTAMGDHHLHTPIVAVEDITVEHLQRLRNKTEKLRSDFLLRVEKSLSAVETTVEHLTSAAENARAGIRAARKRAVDVIDAVVKQKLVEVDDFEEMRLKFLKGQQEDLGRHAESVKSANAFLEKVLAQDKKSNKVCELLSAIEKRVDELANSKVDVEGKPCQHGRLQFQAVSEDELLSKAKETIGTVSPCHASAEHSVIVDETSTSARCAIYTSVNFVLHAHDDNGTPLKNGGDLVQLNCVQTPQGVAPVSANVQVIDNSNGTYHIHATPQHVGDYSLEVSVNGIPHRQPLCVKCYDALTFNPEECQPGLTISPDRRRVTYIDRSRMQSVSQSVLGDRAMQQGQHTWRVHLTRTSHAVLFLGVAEKPGLTAENENHDSAYCWFGWDSRRYVLGKETRVFDRYLWQEGDIILLELDCDANVLSMKNIRTEDSDKIRNLPKKELFAYFCLRSQNESITLL